MSDTIPQELTKYPFPGLRAYERDENDIFFGRQEQIDALLARLESHHFLAVIGISGCGKSSLMKAGLLPELECGYMANGCTHWALADMKPGDQPFLHLAEALLKDEIFSKTWTNTITSIDQAHNYNASVGMLSAQLRRGSRSLEQILTAAPLPEETNLLILVDQFEELFRFKGREEDQAAAFIALILEASRHPNIYIAITMRSDFLGIVAKFSGLPEAINEGIYLTPRMTDAQLQKAICIPAQMYDGSVDDALVNYLINEIGNKPDQLPLLQHALMRLWQASADKNLTLDHLQKAQGISGLLDIHAQSIYQKLGETDQKAAQRMFRALTERTEEGQNIRRPIKSSELMKLLNLDISNLERLTTPFRQSGCNFLMPPATEELTEDSVLDISHESLIAHWKDLRSWVTEEQQAGEMMHRLAEATLRRIERNSPLWLGTDLDEVLIWAQKNIPDEVWAERYISFLKIKDQKIVLDDSVYCLAMRFIENSKKERRKLEIIEKDQIAQKNQFEKLKKKRKRQIIYTSLAGILSIFFLSISLFALHERENSRLNEKIATSQRELALAETKRANYEKNRANEKEREANIKKEEAIKFGNLANEKAEQNILLNKKIEKEIIKVMEQEKIAQTQAKKAIEARQKEKDAKENLNDASVITMEYVNSLNKTGRDNFIKYFIDRDRKKSLLFFLAHNLNYYHEDKTNKEYWSKKIVIWQNKSIGKLESDEILIFFEESIILQKQLKSIKNFDSNSKITQQYFELNPTRTNKNSLILESPITIEKFSSEKFIEK